MAARHLLTSNSKPNSTPISLAITICTCLIVFLAILYFLYYSWRFLVQKSRTIPCDSTSSLNSKLQRFSYKELRNATHNFSDSNSIGKGGSGTVFRGILKDGKLVAVKLLDSSSFQCEEEFRNELKVLGGIKSCPFVVSLLGFCLEKGKRLVVYEYMPNRSLQERLFSETRNEDFNSSSLSWSRRFSIILDVAKALAFLHLDCDPAVIHGDVKPSNVLLDSEFRAKLSDFGLSRLKRLDGKFCVDLFSQDMGKTRTSDSWKSQNLLVNACPRGGCGEHGTATPVESRENDDVEFALALQVSTSSKSGGRCNGNLVGLGVSSFNFSGNLDEGMDQMSENVKGKELSGSENTGEDWHTRVPYDNELSIVDHSKELNLNVAPIEDCGSEDVKHWWWRQDGELCSKDYVMEWIESQINPSTNPYWDEEKEVNLERSDLDDNTKVDRYHASKDQPVQEPVVHSLSSAVMKTESRRWRVRVKKHMKMHDWWKEENLDELRNKNGKPKKLDLLIKKVHHFSFKKRRESCQENNNASKPKKKSPSLGSDMWSGDNFSRELSSTRGTLCYIAPEYGGSSGNLTDIYSFGVVILVFVSGRRPLHVLSSPMKLEKANLISWCRHLAHSGSVLELVDERIREEYSKDEATLCINLALACLQRIPELRPNIGDVVKILEGKLELPPLPLEFSPSPPRKCSRSGMAIKIQD